MDLVIIGSGRMGIRHATGAASNKFVHKIFLIDVNNDALELAKNQLKKSGFIEKFSFHLLSDLENLELKNCIGIVASPARERKKVCNELINKRVKKILIEKPLGQSLEEVTELVNLMQESDTSAYVNLNMRLYNFFVSLKNDFVKIEQLKGYKIVSINTGSIGIGANGIHYLDLLCFLFDADNAELVAGEIEESTLASGRGKDYKDFGGWCTIKFYRFNCEIGRAHISITSKSTVFGNWDIVAPYGQIIINEISQLKTEILRKENSTLPIERYGAEYMDPVVSTINTPFLGDLTSKWIDSLVEGNSVLPNLKESLLAHKLLFDWLSISSDCTKYPIT